MLTNFLALSLLATNTRSVAGDASACPGQLTIVDSKGMPRGLCPLERTSVQVNVAGIGARVTLRQTFKNASSTPIEAVYTFPMAADAAVDRMEITNGDRVTKGVIKPKAEARAIYDAARGQGRTAALLDQERPNIFTQSVANLMPGKKITVEISYVQLLKYNDGQFEFAFPMVVGPRYMGGATPDAGKISPPISRSRVGTNVDLTVNLDAGNEIMAVESVLHKVDTKYTDGEHATIKLARADEIPNKDFILRYRVATDKITNSLLTYWDPKQGGFFTMILMPPVRTPAAKISPKDVIFVMDQSGSQGGFPIEKSKELTNKLIDRLNPNDTFNVLSFSNDLTWLYPESVNNSAENRAEAHRFVNTLQANGGTELHKAINGSLQKPLNRSRTRYIIFNTDGYVGGEYQILDAIKNNPARARVFTFGIGNSVNRFLIDAMSAEGGGDSEIVTLAESADPAVDRLIERMNNPVLTDVAVDWNGMAVTDVLPKRIPDVFDQTPVIIRGRYKSPMSGKVTLSGRVAGQNWSNEIPFNMSKDSTNSDAIRSLWARAQVDEISRGDWISAYAPDGKRTESSARITQLGLDFGLMTAYTSFVAVENRIVNIDGRQVTVPVPIDLADGTFGSESKDEAGRSRKAAPGRGAGGSGGGYGGSVSSAPALSQNGVALVPSGIAASKISYDPADNSIVVGEKSKSTPAQIREMNVKAKVDPKLLKSNAKIVDCLVWASKLDSGAEKALKALGVKIIESDKGLKLYMARIPRANLEAVAQFDWVRKIDTMTVAGAK